MVTEAKRVGETTQRGKELLIQASKIKNIYDNYTRAIRQRQEIHKSNMAANSSSSPPSASVSASSASSNNNNHITIGTPTSTANTPTTNINTPTSSSNNNNNNNQFAMLMRQALTPEQNQQYEKLSIEFQTRAKNIREKHNFIKQNIDTLTKEINKLTDLETKKQLVEKRSELLNNLRQLSQEHNNLRIQFQNGRKNFYIECAKNNPDLQRILQRSSQQASQLSQTQNSAILPPQQQTQNQSAPKQDVVSQPNIQTRNETTEDSKQQQVQVQGQAESLAQSNNTTKAQSKNTTVTSPSNDNTITNTRTDTQTAPTNDQNTTTTTNAATVKNNKTNNNTSTQVTNVNATAATNVSYPSTKQKIFKTSEPNIPITENLNTKQPNAVTYKINRPTMTGGSAMNATSLNTPAMAKIPPYEIDTERVMSKRKLRELVKSVGIDEGDGETVIDGDVEELLLDLADDFVTNVTSFACRLAKHRRSDNLNVKDIQLHLERNWNIRIPGYSADEIRSIRKWNPSAVYNQKLQAVNTERNHKGQTSSGKITKK